MKKLYKHLIWKAVLYICIAAAIVVVAIYLYRSTSISVEKEKKIGITPQQIDDIRRISQWEFLTVEDEELIDTIAHRFLVPDRRLTKIYHGKLRLGIDLSNASPEWVSVKTDSIVRVSITLPPPILLDNNFIDDAATVSFHQSGYWDAAARGQMKRRAEMKMKAYALTSENLKRVEEAASRRFTEIFHALGADTVSINFVTK